MHRGIHVFFFLHTIDAIDCVYLIDPPQFGADTQHFLLLAKKYTTHENVISVLFVYYLGYRKSNPTSAKHVREMHNPSNPTFI